MSLNNISFAISRNAKLTEIEEDFLLEAYRKLFTKMYGQDVFDSFLSVVKRSSSNFKGKKNKIADFSENYSRALDVLELIRNDDNYELLLIYAEAETLVGAGRLRKISDTEASVPEIAIDGVNRELEIEIWKKAISFAELHFTSQGFEKMYVEIPFQEGPLLVRADELGFKEDPKDIVIGEQTRTYLLNKTLERKKMSNLVLVVNKPKNCTSRDVVNKLSKILGTKKIGHTGTLDPMATGVLVCLTGKYTKLVDMITALEKEYIATIKLGVKTDTLDITGNIIENNNKYDLTIDKINGVLNSFLGASSQTVPIYSAVHVDGKRLYEYARENKEVELPKREIFIKDIELLSYENDLIKFRVVVSKGTYIRSLIDDICVKLNVLGTMCELIRTKQGNFKIEDSYNLEEIEHGNYKSLNLDDVLDLNVIELDDSLYKKVSNGNKLELDYDGYILFRKVNTDIALYYFENKLGRLKILF